MKARLRRPLGVTLAVAMSPLLIFMVDRSADVDDAVGLYSYLFGLAEAIVLAGLIATLVVTVLREPIFRVDVFVKAMSEHVYGGLAALGITVWLGVYTGQKGKERRKRRPPQERLEELGGVDWAKAAPSQRWEAAGRLARRRSAAERLREMRRSSGVWRELDRRNPYLLAGMVTVSLVALVFFVTGVTRKVTGATGDRWWLFLTLAVTALLLPPCQLWLHCWLERWWRARSLEDVVQVARSLERKLDRLPRVRVLILTSRLAETRAVLQVFGRHRVAAGDAVHTVFHLGSAGEAEVLLAQSVEQGPGGPGGMALVAAEVVREQAPDFMILAGTCEGLTGAQRPGDIVVAQRIYDLDKRRVVDAADQVRVIDRGSVVPPSTMLLNRFQSGTFGWDGPRVLFGDVLSSATELGSELRRSRLAEDYPGAVAYETEGAGLHAVGARTGVGWILVRAVHGDIDAPYAAARYVRWVLARFSLPRGGR